MFVSGRHVPADEAKALGIIDAIVPGKDLLAEAIAFAKGVAEKRPMPRVRDLDRPGLAQAALLRLAQRELPERVQHLSAAQGIAVSAISVRAQRTRWGSCSPRGEISLNWRLVQVPEWVRDYVILHELAHRRHLNHSARFWQEVERLCPDYEAAEAWLRETGRHVL